MGGMGIRGRKREDRDRGPLTKQERKERRKKKKAKRRLKRGEYFEV